MVLLYSIIAFIIIAADQLIKFYVRTNVDLGEVFFTIPCIAELTFVKNTGAAFSILSGNVRLLGIISAVFCVGVIIWWIIKKPKSKLLNIATALLFSGAAGNGIDRVLNGYVVDYIDLEFMNFPVFNLADIAITAGAVLLVLHIIIFDEDKK